MHLLSYCIHHVDTNFLSTRHNLSPSLFTTSNQSSPILTIFYTNLSIADSFSHSSFLSLILPLTHPSSPLPHQPFHPTPPSTTPTISNPSDSRYSSLLSHLSITLHTLSPPPILILPPTTHSTHLLTLPPSNHVPLSPTPLSPSLPHTHNSPSSPLPTPKLTLLFSQLLNRPSHKPIPHTIPPYPHAMFRHIP